MEVDPTTAGLLLSAILSDTLMFRSPTCTPVDERAARELAHLGVKGRLNQRFRAAPGHQQLGAGVAHVGEHRELAQLAGVNLEEYADEMFSHGGDVSGKTAAEVFNGDYKIFTSGDVRFGVGQGSYMTEKNRKAARALVDVFLENLTQYG